MEAPPAEIGSVAAAIVDGRLGADRGIVGLTFRPNDCDPTIGCTTPNCTGVIVADGVILTAAHCLRNAGWGHAGDDDSFIGEVGVTYFDETHKCVTRAAGNLQGTCSVVLENDVVVATGIVHPNASPNNPAFDIGVLHTGTHWASFGIGRDELVRLALSSTRNGTTTTALQRGDSFAAYGFGANGSADPAALRFDPDPVDVDEVTNSPATGLLLRNTADRVRMCKGDSGSPAYVHTVTGLPISAGLLSAGSDSATCNPEGTTQVWTMLQTSADFIRTTLEGTFGATCSETDLLLPSNVSMHVFDCM